MNGMAYPITSTEIWNLLKLPLLDPLITELLPLDSCKQLLSLSHRPIRFFIRFLMDTYTNGLAFSVFDSQGKIVASSQLEFPNYNPVQGWAEHDIEEIFSYTKTCMENVIKEMHGNGMNAIELIKAIGITNQRETTCVWDKRTGKPLHRAIVWLDVRTRDLVHALTEKTPSKSANHFMKKCGLPISTYFSAVKLKWLIDNVPVVKEAHENDTLAFGTVDSWLLYVLFFY